jgi:hypothetical protein
VSNSVADVIPVSTRTVDLVPNKEWKEAVPETKHDFELQAKTGKWNFAVKLAQPALVMTSAGWLALVAYYVVKYWPILGW